LSDVAVLLWGVGYLWAAYDVPAHAAAIFELNVVGSTTPAAIVLYWCSLALVVVAWAFTLPRVPPAWQNVALSLLAVGAVAVLGEGAVRVRALVAPATQGFPTYTSALWDRRYVRLNSAGFRDTEHMVARAPGTKRVLLIGDSFAFGLGIPRTGDRMGERLAIALDGATGSVWEPINASHPDRSTLDEIALLDSTIRYRPDVVILVYVFNDIDYLYPVTKRTVLTEAPETAWQRVHPVRLLFRNSFLFQELYVRLRALRSSLPGTQRESDPYADSTLVQRHLRDVARFVDKAGQGGAVVGIVPFDPTVAQSPAARTRYESFVGRAIAAGLPVWRVDSAFDGFSLSQLRVNRLDGHPNAVANQVVAARIERYIVQSLDAGDRASARPSRRSAAVLGAR
jgi:lysophospholipase L1-like esterase